MKLPHWFPAATRPWNPAFRDTWDAMSHEERQWSLMVDLVIVVGVLLMLFGLAGCERASGAAPPPGDTSETVRGIPGSRDTTGLLVVTDPVTGCEYLQLYADAITPRMTKEGGGSYRQKGCK